MHNPPEPIRKEQQLLRNARKEGLIIMVLWALCLTWSVGCAYLMGYNRPAKEIQLILGMPSWVFYSVVLPWAVCLLFSIWFCFFYMADDDLGQDPEEEVPT